MVTARWSQRCGHGFQGREAHGDFTNASRGIDVVGQQGMTSSALAPHSEGPEW